MPLPGTSSVVDFFRQCVQSRPAAIAVKHGERKMDFRTLDRLSNQLANRLLRTGLQPEEVVALALNCSCAYVIAALGVLKAGGAYLPIDIDLPDQRLFFLLKDSEAQIIFTAPSHRERFHDWNGTVLALDENGESLAEESDEAVTISSDPKRLAYVIYTSGSTGRPKGVEIEHHSLINLVCVFQRWLGLTPNDRATLIANIAFDASVADLWPCLCAGGTVLIPPKKLITDIDALIKWLADEGATYSFVPTALVELMLERPWPKQTALRFLGTGGDTLHVRPPPGLPFRLVNGYGPAENTVVSTWTIVSPEGGVERPSIGRPVGNVRVYVLDERGKPMPPGEEGELYLGGEQVARCYLNRPELTRERFLPDPFSGKPGARMYRTGDWARWRPDGELDFIGRRDDQVQIRGRRVELGEIEQELCGHPAVQQACCQPVVNHSAVTGITAHVALKDSQPETDRELREYLSKRLPAYMVPVNFLFYKDLPLTPNGKVDRAALRALEAMPITRFEASLPPNSQERAIAHLWFQLLPHASPADINSTFASHGGDSLHAVKLLLGVEEITGRRVALSTFLLEPTLPGLIREATASRPNLGQRVVVLRQEGNRSPLFCLYGLSGDINHYFDFAKVMGDDQPVLAVRSLALEDPDKLPPSIEEAAQRVVAWIRATNPKSTPALVGYSWGGILAFEVARQWFLSEGAAPFLALIGTPAPRRKTTTAFRIWHFTRWLPSWAWHLAADRMRTGQHRSMAEMSHRLVRYFVKDPAEEQSPVPRADWASPLIARHFIAIADRYHPVIIKPFKLHVFRERFGGYVPHAHPLESSKTWHEPDCGWGRWSGCPARVHWINSNHDAILRPPSVTELAVTLRAMMDEYYGK